MDKKLCLYVCQAYFPEVRQILNSGDYPDVRLMAYPYDCLSSPIEQDKVLKLLEKCAAAGNQVIMIGSSCLRSQSGEINTIRNLKLHELNYCSELILSKELIEYYIQKRYYLVSNGWLVNYQQHISNWGFEPAAAKAFFAESADKILFLESGIPGDFQQQIEAISAYMGLPVEVLPVGLSHCRLLVDTVVFQWREQKERELLNERIAGITKKAADYAMIFEQMQHLVDLKDEHEIVQEVFQLLNLLFAPRNIIYHPFNLDEKNDDLIFSLTTPGVPETNADLLVIEARNQGEVLGKFSLMDLGFPEFMEQYQAMRNVIGGLGGLAIANARKFQTIRENEVRLKQLAQELQAANANKDKFFSIIAHDLRSPFSAFLGLTELMTDDTEGMTLDEMRGMARVIQNSAKNLFSQLENLLEWSKLQMTGVSVTLSAIGLRNLADEEMELILHASAKKQIELLNEIPDFLQVYSDRNMIRSIIRNLLANAVKFSPIKGKVTLAAKQHAINEVEVSVTDRGIGMSQEIIENLFSLQKKTNRKGTMGEASTGLGLLICNELLIKLGGNLRVESQEGAGSTFRFTIPELR